MPTGAVELLAMLDAFDWDAWRKTMRDGIEPIYRDVVLVTGKAVYDGFTFDDPFTQEFATKYIGERIVQLEAFTRENVSALLVRTLNDAGGGLSPLELSKLVRDEVRQHVKNYEMWRANRIARTEAAFAYNHGNTLGWKQAGGTTMLVTDGDRHEPCASANGAIWTIAECLDNPLAHPNCTRAFTPAD